MRARGFLEGPAVGPLITLGAIGVIELLAMLGFRVPDPPAITLIAVIFAAFQGGFTAGLLGAAIALAHALYSLSASLPGPSLHETPGGALRVVIWSVAMPSMAILAGALRRRLLDRAVHLEVTNAELQELAMTDPLTGLKNRRALMERLDLEVTRTRRTLGPVSVVMLDVDHLKPINDTFGHPAGDEVITDVAAAVGASLRATDLAARLGGDEFAIVLPDTGRAGALAVADRIRRAIERPPRPRREVTVTVSLGVATLDPATDPGGEPVDGPALLARADRALYEAKGSGRDRTVPLVY